MKYHIPINRILFGLLILAIFVVIAITYMIAFHHNPPVVFNNIPFPVDKEQYKVGETIIVTVDYCRYTSASYIRYISFIDSLVFYLPESISGGGPMGCRILNVQSATIPEALPPGTYYLRGKNEYHVNVLAVRVVEWTSKSFEVIP